MNTGMKRSGRHPIFLYNQYTSYLQIITFEFFIDFPHVSEYN